MAENISALQTNLQGGSPPYNISTTEVYPLRDGSRTKIPVERQNKCPLPIEINICILLQEFEPINRSNRAGGVQSKVRLADEGYCSVVEYYLTLWEGVHTKTISNQEVRY